MYRAEPEINPKHVNIECMNMNVLCLKLVACVNMMVKCSCALLVIKKIVHILQHWNIY